MKDLASGTAYLRHYESMRPTASRICNDDMAYHFVAWWVKAIAWLCKPFPTSLMDWAFEKKGTGISGFMAVRTRLFDEYVLRGIAAGAQQYVILGAGLDSRPYRFKTQLAAIKTFEVDHPRSQAVKKQRVAEYYGRLPDEVTYVPIDFNTDELMTGLKKAGYKPSVPSVFTLEGVLMYLDETSVRDTMNLIHNESGAGSSVVFDYVYAAALDGRLNNRVIRHMNSLRYIFNEPVLFGIEQGEAEKFMCSVGFDRAEDFPPRRLYELYLKPIAPQRTISDTYAIAIAYKDQ